MELLNPPRFVTGPAMLVAGIRRVHTYAGAELSVPDQWRQFRALGPIPGQRSGRVYGVICASTAQGFEYLAGIEVETFDDLSSSLGRIRLLEQLYAVFTHEGHVSQLTHTWQTIWREWLPGSGYAAANAPDFELYDHRFDPVSGEGEVEIWFPITALRDVSGPAAGVSEGGRR